MKKNTFLFFTFLFLFFVSAHAQQFQWSVQTDSQPFGSYSTAGGSFLIPYSDGGIVYCLNLPTTCMFDSITISAINDAFISRINPNGTVRWLYPIGRLSGGGNSMSGSAELPDGSLIFTGSGGGGFDFGTVQINGAGSMDGFVAKYDSLGICIWAKSFGTASLDEAIAVSADATGNIYVAGRSQGSLIFDSAPIVNNGFFLVKLDSSGNLLWHKSFQGYQAGVSLALDEVGNIYMGGWFNTSFSIDSITLVAPSTNADIFLAKYSSSGNFLGERQYGQYGSETITKLSWGDGYLYACGALNGLNAGYDSVLFTNYYQEMAVMKFDTSLNLVKYRYSTSQNNELAQVNSCFYDTTYHGLLLTGNYGGGSGLSYNNFNFPANNDNAVFFMRVDTSLTCQWLQRLNGTDIDVGQSLCYFPSGTLYLSGIFKSPILNIGSTQVTSTGGTHIFLTKYLEDVAVSSLENFSSFEIYPIPSDQNIFIDATIPFSGNYLLTITDISGREMQNHNIYLAAGKNSINLSCADIPPGIYFLSITGKNNFAERKKILVAR